VINGLGIEDLFRAPYNEPLFRAERHGEIRVPLRKEDKVPFMDRLPSKRGAPKSVAEALPGNVPLVLFLGGPFSAGNTTWRSSFMKILRRFAADSGEEDIMGSLLGPLGRAGFDPLNPGRVGLSASPGLALFHAEQAVCLVAAVRSPKKFREALQKAVRRRIRVLKVPGAAEAGWGVIDEGWNVAFARRPPWLYALFGPEVNASASSVLADLVSGTPRESLAVRKTFRQAAGPRGLQGDLAVWMGEEAVSMLGPDPEVWKDVLKRWSELAGRAGSMLDAMIHVHGAAMGVSMDRDELRLEGLAFVEGTWLDALENMVGRGSQCVIGPRALRKHCPVWALTVLDWTLFARTLPVVANALDRITGQWGDLLKRTDSEGRANGMAALGICGLRPFPLESEAAAEIHPLSFIDAFLVLEMLGQNLPAQIAGRLVDVMGDVMRDGMKRFRRKEAEQLSSVVFAGHRFYVALRRGAMILATSRAALAEARNMLETQASETLSPGFLVGGELEPHGALRMLGNQLGRDSVERFSDDMLREFQRWGAARLQVQRVPAGLRMIFRQTLHDVDD